MAAAVVVAACRADLGLKLPGDGEFECKLVRHGERRIVWRHWRYDDDDVLDEATEQP